MAVSGLALAGQPASVELLLEQKQDMVADRPASMEQVLFQK
jgi:hypothetical protein